MNTLERHELRITPSIRDLSQQRSLRPVLWLCLSLLAIFFLPNALAQGGAKQQSSAHQGSCLKQPPQGLPLGWTALASISCPANNGSNEAVWETWATDRDTFPEYPRPAQCATNPDPAHCPLWPGAYVPETPRKATQQGLAHIVPKAKEVVYRNKAAFDYIVNHDLWYQEGLEAAFNQGDAVNFPPSAIEVKSNWIPIKESDKDHYHWKIGKDGNLYGLVALHIMTKAIPIWTWQTFEHVDNPGRCDFIGCHDAFGQVPANVAPHKVLGQKYPSEKLTPQLLALFKAVGLPDAWQNYRLKGVQGQFVNSTGAPILLGNSVTEKGFVPTASCATCHARSTAGPVVDGDMQRLEVFESKNPIVGSVGAPNPDWYTAANGSRKLLQLDFVWAFINAKSIKNTPKNTSQGSGGAQ